MVTNMPMWSATLNSFSRPCAVIDALDDLTLDVGADLLTDIMLGVGVDVLTDMLAVPIIDLVSATDDVDISTDDENVNGLAAVMPPLEFTFLSAPRAESMSFC